LAVRLFQAEIAKVRIRNALEILAHPDLEYDALVARIAHLDTETYYTVAFDVLKLVTSFLPKGIGSAFKNRLEPMRYIRRFNCTYPIKRRPINKLLSGRTGSGAVLYRCR
jgi:hypothetical protein